jgi:hypothetical protein
MQAPTGTAVGWQYVSVNLAADATTELLSFLAWGNNGSTVNLPPMAFLSGVDSPPGLVPEPSTWAMMILGSVLAAIIPRGRTASDPIASFGGAHRAGRGTRAARLSGRRLLRGSPSNA